jgi:hypothetical protein
VHQAIRCSIAVLAVAAALPTAASAYAAGSAVGVRDCHTWASYPNVLISSVRNMGCKRAARDMRRYQGPIYTKFKTPGGFRCKRVSGVPEGGQWRCVKNHKAYRFEFGD